MATAGSTPANRDGRPSPAIPACATAAPARKRLLRRSAPDRSQSLRRSVQLAFLALNVWIGVEFYLWVRYFESGGRARWVERPAGVDGWLPIDALMSLKHAVLSGRLPEVHPAGLFLLLAFVAISLLLRKAFCSWLCPVGTVSEWLWKLGQRWLGCNTYFPRWLDLPLRVLKYLLLGFFVWVIVRMPADALEGFLASPYAVIADVKMLNFFRHLGRDGGVVLLVLAALSLILPNFWCRYLCPYGALMGLIALFSPARVRREPEACIDCGRCARACPAALPVDRLVQIRSAECTACLECVAVCPAKDALALEFPRRRRVSPWAIAALVATIFVGAVGYARLTGHWQTRLPESLYMRLVPAAEQASHPGM